MTRSFDQLDTRLLNVIQAGIPLVERPFSEIARQLDADEQMVLDRLVALKSPPDAVIRQMSAIFDSKTLGYESSLVAARVDEWRIEQAAEALNQHPGVTHNYQRNHAYNLWYTIAVPPDSRLGLQRTVEILHQRSGSAVTRLFPTLKLFKIGVKFDVGGGDDDDRPASPAFSEAQRREAMRHAVTDGDKPFIRVLQQDLPIVARPFDAWAGQIGVGVDELLAMARKFADWKWMRRFSAVLHHRAAGLSANGMGAWAVPPQQQERFGQLAAGFKAVSHCYLRPTYEDWPYSIFTMVHGTSEEACNAVLKAISDATGIEFYIALFSSREFKKVRLKYFLGDIEAWEAGALVERA